ncbi:MAG: sigma-70 family RNA polymerase sigma factor [Kofleriaceae bacterium]
MSPLAPNPTAASAPAALGPVDAEVRALCRRGEYDEATAAALRGYGTEILRFLLGVLRDSVAAGDAFAQFAEDLWRGLASFEWRCSLRTWTYVVARRAMARTRRAAQRHDRRRIPLSEAPELLAVVEHVRTATELHLRSEVKSAMSELRDQLSEDERTLLILRVDRGLGWREIAEVLSPEPLSSEEITRKAAQLRKQLERLKDRLRALAVEAGVLAR